MRSIGSSESTTGNQTNSKEVAIKQPIIEAIRTEGSLTDIDIAFNTSIEVRERIITDMEMAGFKLRNELLGTLTFLREVD